jgi:hypothetical protein
MAKLIYSTYGITDKWLARPTERDADDVVLRRIQELQAGFRSKLDVSELAGRFGYDLCGLSIPQTVSVLPLYVKPSVTDLGKLRIHTFCIGLKRSESDPHAGEVVKSWKIGDLPEVERPIAVDTEDVTCYAKYHLLTDDKGARLVISPIQKTRLSGDRKPVVEEITQKIDELAAKGGKSGEIHHLKRQIRLIEKSPHVSVFKYDDRDVALALVGLAVAEALDVSFVGFRTYPGRNTGYAKRAERILQFLRTGKNSFRFSEGYI